MTQSMIRVQRNFIFVTFLLLVLLEGPLFFGKTYTATANAACESEERVLSQMKADAPQTIRSRVYVGKTTLSFAFWLSSKLAENAGADKVVFYEKMDNDVSPSAVFFRKDCRITEIKISVPYYRFILFVRGEFPGAHIF